MKQTKKMTRNQRELLQHSPEYIAHAKQYNNQLMDYRTVEDTKTYLTVIDGANNILTIDK